MNRGKGSERGILHIRNTTTTKTGIKIFSISRQLVLIVIKSIKQNGYLVSGWSYPVRWKMAYNKTQFVSSPCSLNLGPIHALWELNVDLPGGTFWNSTKDLGKVAESLSSELKGSTCMISHEINWQYVSMSHETSVQQKMLYLFLQHLSQKKSQTSWFRGIYLEVPGNTPINTINVGVIFQ